MIIALLLIIILAVLNFEPGTFLSGWDTIHSEFNVWLDLKRTIFGVWQEYRGVGVLDGMAHTADLIRQLILLPFSFVLPVETVRYFSQFLWLGIGALGMAYWFDSQILKGKNWFRRFIVSSVVGAAYLLNLGTISNFFLPLESFSVFYAFLPWCLWALFEVLKKPGRRQWIVLLLTNLLITPSFYIPTVFIVYALISGLVTSSYLILNRQLEALKSASIAATLILVVNAFWLLPFGHFVLNASHYPREAQINQMSTEETFLQNKHRGTLKDLALLRGYYYDIKEEDAVLMQPWITHFEKPEVSSVAYALAVLVIIGFVLGGKKSVYLAPALVLTAVALLSNEPFIAPVHDFVSRTSPFLGQVFRSPYTKFVVPLVMLYAYYLGLVADTIVGFLEKVKRRYLSLAVLIGLLIASLWITKPVFSGHLFAEGIKTEIPDEYFQLFEFFEKKPEDSRIVFLPQYSYWGWNRYEWGYFGSGFTWWGLPQSTMDRAFDSWNSSNENFYWELSRAIFADDQQQFDDVLQKYRVQWLVLDENVSKLYSDETDSNFDAINNLLLSSGYKKHTSLGKLSIYENQNVENGYLRTPVSATGVGSVQKWNNWDQVYEKHGDYVYIPEGSGLTWKYLYPYASLFTNKTASKSLAGIGENQFSYNVATVIPTSAVNSQLIIYPSYDFSELSDQGYYLHPTIYLNNSLVGEINTQNISTISAQVREAGRITTLIPKLPPQKRSAFINQQLFSESTQTTCGIKGGNETEQSLKKDQDSIQLELTALNNFDCKDIYLNDIETTNSYLVTTTTTNATGLPLSLNWINTESDQILSQVKLNHSPSTNKSYFVLPPMQSDNTEYLLSFTNHSYKNFQSRNSISELSVQVFPYQSLKNIRLEHLRYTTFNKLKLSNNKRIFSWLYSLTYTFPDTSNDYGLVVLDQAYDSGWIIIPTNLLSKKHGVVAHTIFNNWSNAWIVENTGTVETHAYLIYLPQVLAFAGFLMLSLSFIVLISRKNHATT